MIEILLHLATFAAITVPIAAIQYKYRHIVFPEKEK